MTSTFVFSNNFPAFRWVLRFVASVLAGALCACTTTFDEHHSSADGWYIGTVRAIEGAPNFPKEVTEDCRKEAARLSPDPYRYAVIDYYFTPRGHWVKVVPFDVAMDLKRGDEVYFSTRDCRVVEKVRRAPR